MFSPLLSPSQNLFSAAVGDAAARTEIAAVIPVKAPCTEADCGRLPMGGAVNPGCPVCGGDGEITTQMTSVLQARVFWLTDARIMLPNMQHPMLTGANAEVALSFPLFEERDVTVLLTSGQVYFIVDNVHVRPTTTMRDTVYGETSFVVFGNIENQER